jgi:hypothetical protein
MRQWDGGDRASEKKRKGMGMGRMGCVPTFHQIQYVRIHHLGLTVIVLLRYLGKTQIANLDKKKKTAKRRFAKRKKKTVSGYHAKEKKKKKRKGKKKKKTKKELRTNPARRWLRTRP